ncbi:MAG: helix-turn-helix domain-containing protein [Hafnia sp.]|uniref:helix-turn-helix domain-containing protein n=1 Tax=Hafnia sp. TaxID=1873498 RepID=UPI002FC7932E
MGNSNHRSVIEKPLESIHRLMTAFVSISKPYLLDSKNIEARLKGKDAGFEVYLLTKGRVDIWREVDNRLVETAFAPSILGLQGSAYRSQHYHLKFPAGAEVSTIPLKAAMEIIELQSLWRDVFYYQGYLNDRQLHHESMLINSSTYETVCIFLKDLSHYSDSERAKLSVADFILQRSNLARSGVMKVLADLRFGGYIDIQHGKLIKILNNFPRNY